MMTRRKWLWSALLALPLVVASVVYANTQAPSPPCPLTSEELACKKCCPLSESKRQSQEQPFVCPVTGEQLRCEKCCPLTDTQ